MNAIYLNRARDPGFTREVERRSGQDLSTCYQCGECTAGCPAAFVFDRQANQLIRAAQLGLRHQALGCESVWFCLSCSMCSQRCPNEIDVAAVMETLRHMAREEGLVAVPRMEKFWQSFLDMVRAFGRVYEIGTMGLYMMRAMKPGTDLDLAPDALKLHKLPFLPKMAPAQASAAVARIMGRYAERAKREGGGS